MHPEIIPSFKMLKRLLAFLLLLTAAFLIWNVFTHRSAGEAYASKDSLLYALGSHAYKTHDVPVAALLYYGEKIIGRGYNTVSAENNPAGHAEINAIKQAMNHVGYQVFKNLSKDSLLLISTYEPCPMCHHMLSSNGIYRLVFLEEKSIWYKFRQECWPDIKLLFTRRQASSTLQKKMFEEAMRLRYQK